MNKKMKFNSLYHLNTIKKQFGLPQNGVNVIAGPCSVENEKMLDTIACRLSKLGVKFLRGGAYKPRTSPYDFQGLKDQGIEILHYIGKKYNMLTVSEVVDTRHVEKMINYIDILQIGSRNMQNFELLKEVGRCNHPVLLKRGMCATIEEFKLAAEYITSNGNKNIIMCERGIRTFETATRNTLDIACVSILKKETNLPVIVDLSHSLGRKDIVIDILKAVIAVGADGLMVEVHNDPERAITDKHQQLNFQEFENLMNHIKVI